MPVKWKKDVEAHDFPAAYNYLSLCFTAKAAEQLVEALKGAPVIEHRANDILRASGLPLLPATDASVQGDLEKIHKGEKLSPVLLVVSEAYEKLIIGDGYHRINALVAHNPKDMVRCKIVYTT